MHFTELRLTNFGLFSGEHHISLHPDTPSVGYTTRPIILIGGKNGAGKTTLLEAIKVCLYGSSFLGNRMKLTSYEAYLNQRIHRQPGAPLAHTFAEVGVTFSHTGNGSTHTYEIRRTWQRRPTKLDEVLVVFRDGTPLTEQEYPWWDTFLRGLLPTGLADLFFFDGEKIQALAEDSDYEALAASIRALLGLDMLDQLRADLNIYLARQKRVGQTGLQQELAALAEEQAEVEEAFQAAHMMLGNINAQIDHQEGKIEEQERLLTSEGALVAAQRSELKQTAKDLQVDIERYEREISKQAEGLLPFAVVPHLSMDLLAHLIQEDSTQQHAAVEEAVTLLSNHILDVIKQDDAWLNGPSLGENQREYIVEGLAKAIEQAKIQLVGFDKPVANAVSRHDLAKHDRQELLNWLGQLRADVPKSIIELGLALETATTTLSRVESTLLNVPADEAIQPILNRLAALNQEVGRLKAHQAIQASIVQELRNKRTELERRQQELNLRTLRGDDPTRRAHLVGRIQNALVKYEDVLRKAKIRELEKQLVVCFNQLLRKGNYVTRVSIDPQTFETILFNKKGDPLPKQELSAGEKQIYAIAVLWALRLVSGRSLPIIIDTPLGRLDSDHRRLLVQRYFPQASHQVILLSTDTEIDATLYADLAPAISQEYHLFYQNSEASTKIMPGYFWSGEEHNREVEIA